MIVESISEISAEDSDKKLKSTFINCLVGAIFILNSFFLEWLTNHDFSSQICAIIGALILCFPITMTAIKDLINGKVYMNELVTIALLASFVQQDFRTAGIIGFFMLVSLLIEQKSAAGAKTSIDALLKLTPPVAKLITKDGVVEVKVGELKIGDKIQVMAGDNFPVDGKITKGTTSINEASITGESLPVDKSVTAEVFAGTSNLTGLVEVEVTRIGADTTLGKVKSMIEDAENSKTPIMRLIDHYVGFYTPTVLIIAAMVWFFTHDMDRVVAILVVSCPCAMVLASPSAIIGALASGARVGLLFKNVSHLETIANVDTFVFDKTGTLTEGQLEVSVLHPLDGVEAGELLEAATKAESASNHPVANAIKALAEKAGLTLELHGHGHEVAGKGVSYEEENSKYFAGRVAWLEENGYPIDELTESMNKKNALSVVAVAKNGRTLGWIGLADKIRPSCEQMITDLKALNIARICMVTGDNEAVAKSVAKKVGIDIIEAGCLPEDKVKFVEDLKSKGAKVAVIGDGINDAPALSSGDTSVAMGVTGSDIAVNSAAIALMNSDLSRVPFLLLLSRKTRAIINQNLAAGLLFIIAGLYLSAMGALPPIAAAIIHSMSSVFIIFNSARLVKETLLNSEENND